MTFATLATIHELLVNNFDEKASCYNAACSEYKAYSDTDDYDRINELKGKKLHAYSERCVAYNALTDFENHDFT